MRSISELKFSSRPPSFPMPNTTNAASLASPFSLAAMGVPYRARIVSLAMP